MDVGELKARVDELTLRVKELEKMGTRQWFDTMEAAEYIGVSVSAMRKLVQRGKIRPDTPGGTGLLKGHRFSRVTLDAFLGR
jgi:excisionase family DNA binding protein